MTDSRIPYLFSQIPRRINYRDKIKFENESSLPVKKSIKAATEVTNRLIINFTAVFIFAQVNYFLSSFQFRLK